MLPWKETSVESERLRFVERVTAGEEPVTELCRQSGISRKTGYKLIHRYKAYGEDGLLDRSRAPHDHPNATPRERERIVEAKRTHPTFKKLIAWLQDLDPGVPARAPRAPLDRAGLVQRRRRRRRASPWSEPFAHAIVPSTTSGASTSKAGSAPATGRASIPSPCRTRLATSSPARGWSAPPARRHGARARARSASPRSPDRNGPPFAGVGLGSPAWWARVPERIEPGHPEQNGRLERLHRTLKAETASPPRANRRQRRLRPLPAQLERPHEALGQRPPVRLYTPSFRPSHASARRNTGPRSPCAECATTARSSGGDRVYVSASLRGVPIGLVQQDRAPSIQRTPPHRRPRRPRAADRQDPGTRVTYVPGPYPCARSHRARAARRASAQRALLPPRPRSRKGLRRELGPMGRSLRAERLRVE